MQDTEIWLPVVHFLFHEFYEVSSHGRVKSLDRLINNQWGSQTLRKERILRQTLDNAGYPTIGLNRQETHQTSLVHVLVGKAFISNPINNPQINHKDGNKANNHISNLEWCTAAENKQHSIQVLGKGIGITHGMAKLTVEDVRTIRELAKSMNYSDIEKLYPVIKSTIANIVSGKIWSHIDPHLHRPCRQHTKLTPEDIPKIRDLAKQGVRQRVIAKQFGVHLSNISSVVRHATWKHIK